MFAQTTESMVIICGYLPVVLASQATQPRPRPTHRGHLRFELIQCEALTEEISLMVERNRATSGP